MGKIFFLLFLSTTVLQLHSETLFSSNPLGMPLKTISTCTKDTYEWILERKSNRGIETSILYHRGSKIKTTVRVSHGEGSTVSEYRNNILRKKDTYRGIYLMRETIFSSDGKTETVVNHWKSGQLIRADHLRDGRPVSQDLYTIDERGRLKRATRTLSGGSSLSVGFQYSNNRLLHEWNSEEGLRSVYSYSKGRITQVETYDAGALVSTQKIKSVSGGKKEIVDTFRDGKKIQRLYDDKDRVIYESYTGPEINRIIVYTYSNNTLHEKRIKEPGMREKHLYSYSEDGTLVQETVYRNGELLKQIRPEKGDRSEEIIYKDGTPQLKVVYEHNVIVSREPYQSSE